MELMEHQVPSGITQLNNTTTYTITSPIVLSGGDDAIGEGIAACDIGDFCNIWRLYLKQSVTKSSRIFYSYGFTIW